VFVQRIVHTGPQDKQIEKRTVSEERSGSRIRTSEERSGSRIRTSEGVR